MADIYRYLDYHQWLSAAFARRKAEKPSFSHRNLASRLGLKSSCYILYVMQGKRKLTEEMAVRLAEVFRLKKRETEYFLQLLRYAHAKSAQEKQFQYERLVSMRRGSVKTVAPDLYRFYEKWYYPVIREAIALKPFSGDYEALSSMVVPAVSSADAEAAITVLCELGLLYRDENGMYHKKNRVISTGEQWESAVIHAHQRELLSLGARALEELPRKERDISHLMITASEKTMELVRKRVAELRAELLEVADSEEHPDRVLQCTFSVFPTAQRKGGSR